MIMRLSTINQKSKMLHNFHTENMLTQENCIVYDLI